MSRFYSFSLIDSRKNAFDLASLKGKVVLVVNMASKCGFAVQNAPLDELYKKYADKGLVVLGMPSNDFYQEPSADGAQCAVSYGVSFPVMQMCHVNGTDTHPLYQFLKAEKKSFFMERIKWNYEKFLIDREGQVVERYSSGTTPSDLEAPIEALLAK